MDEEKEVKTGLVEAKDIVDENVILLKADLDAHKKLVVDLAKSLEEMTKKYEQARAFLETDTRAKLVAEIKPRTTVSGEILSRMSLEDLKKMKETLDVTRIPAFKAGTPLAAKEDPRMKLDNMFGDFMGKLRGEK